MNVIRILVVDDQAITRSGLRNLLEKFEDIQIVDEAINGEEAIVLSESLQPDLILMDLHMSEVNGIDATRQIHRTSPHIRILVLTIFDDDTSVFPAIRAGAHGYLLKDTKEDDLIRAIQTVASGGAVFSPGIAAKVLGYLSTLPSNIPHEAFDKLTQRETQIMELMAEGKTNSEIALTLSLSPKTVSNYISNVLLKVHAADRAKLMLMAIEAGMGKKST
ncbi:MAG: DNA-binding response regulator [Chloroflexi bacterium]|nr:MAG: DNA-binding response regulator [Chloroflexota bacterium]MBL1195117.1 DNA-binding response regulator [Chloroflexota bacterium]NOH12402.1 response regulator transcription factor [Chloroflexota bacterium]